MGNYYYFLLLFIFLIFFFFLLKIVLVDKMHLFSLKKNISLIIANLSSVPELFEIS